MKCGSKIFQLTVLALFTVLLLALSFANFSTLQHVFAQEDEYQVVKTDRSEHFVFPYTASNQDRRNPLVYTYDEPKDVNWILTLDNTMSYAAREDAKTIVRIQEAEPSEKFVEIAMYGEVENPTRFWVAINTVEGGYLRVYDDEINGWSKEGLITISHANNQGLTITNGKRIVVDKTDMDGFAISSVAVYGLDEPSSLINTYEGNMTFELLYGDPADSPLFLVPAGIMIGMGALIGGLLVMKKRKS